MIQRNTHTHTLWHLCTVTLVTQAREILHAAIRGEQPRGSFLHRWLWPKYERCLQICRVCFFFFPMAVRGVITEADENSVSRISRRRFNKNISAFKTDSVSRSLWERQKTNKHRCAAIWAEAARHRHVFSSIEQTQIEPRHKKNRMVNTSGRILHLFTPQCSPALTINDLYLLHTDQLQHQTHSQVNSFDHGVCGWGLSSHVPQMLPVFAVVFAVCFHVCVFINNLKESTLMLPALWSCTRRPESSITRGNVNFSSVHPIKNTNVTLMEELDDRSVGVCTVKGTLISMNSCQVSQSLNWYFHP